MCEVAGGELEVALEFDSKRSFRNALEILFKEKISYVLVGNLTVILSEKNALFLEHLNPKQSFVLSAADLPPEEIAELRRENLGFNDE